MNKKVKILGILAFLFLLVIIGSYSYSKYRSDVTGKASADVAKWNISVNDCSITSPDTSDSTCFSSRTEADGAVTVVKNFKIDSFTYSNNGDTNVKSGKLSPGSSGSFKIKIKPNDTEVSIKYTVNSKIMDDSYSLKYYVKGPDDISKVAMPTTGYEGIIKYDASRKADYEETLTFYVEWENIDTDEANEKDTAIGTKSSNPVLDIPLEITFEQYNG